VILALVERYLVFQADQLTIHAGPGETVLHQTVHLLPELAFATADDRGKNHDPVLRSERHDPLHDLLRGLTADRLPAFRAVRHAN
jgi:hypothetical protein